MNDAFEIKQGDCLQVLKTLESESVQMCVTSPPYFGLRDYGVDGQIGLEATPALFVAKMVEVFDEVRRVLKPDGTLWLNLGDSYAGSWGNYGGQNRGNGSQREITNGSSVPNPAYDGLESFRPATANPPGLKPKDLIGIPWRVAFALQEAGWWLRQDIIWSKPNPMPESVTDRCTKAHEYLFLLTKSAKYYYDNEAIKEPCVYDDARMYNDFEAGRPERGFVGGASRGGGTLNKVKTDSWKGSQFHTGKTSIHQLGRSSTNRDRSLPRNRNGITGSLDDFDGATRNKRSVWTVTTQPYSEAHFATFPPKLIEPCVLAGSREGDIVLDPFNGSGTTGMVALQHRRRYLGIELNPEYIALSEKRLSEIQVKLF